MLARLVNAVCRLSMVEVWAVLFIVFAILAVLKWRTDENL